MNAFQSFIPERNRFPILVSNPHVGLEIHPLRPELTKLSKDLLLRDVDFEVHQIWEEAAKSLNLSWIAARFHRYNLDLNRPAQLNSDFVKNHPISGKGETKGLFWKQSTAGEDLGFQLLEEQTAKALIHDIWTPYYGFIEKELKRLKSEFGFALLLDGHSMPSRGEKNHTDAGAPRADIVPGNLEGKTCPQSLSELVTKTCAKHSLTCAFNKPYKGGNITQHFFNPKEHIYALQIEINRKLYMNESTKDLNPEGIRRLKNFSQDLLENIISSDCLAKDLV